MKRNIKCFLITVFLIAIYSIHSHASDLKWDTSTGDVSGYTIYYGLSQGNYPFSEDVGNVTQYSLNNFSLSEGTTYYFVVRAYNDSGESGDSNVTTYAVPSAGDTTPPFAPAGVSGEIISEDILLTWEPSSEADISVYRVYYGTSTRNYGLPIPVEGTEYSISGLDTDVLYYFAVTAVDTSGNESGYSFPEIIKTISISKDIEGSMLKWGAAIGDVSGYKIYFGTSKGNYTEEVDVGEVTQYSLNNFSLTIGITYYFVVVAYNDYGESGNSNIATYAIGELEDTTSPVVTISEPTANEIFNSFQESINISGTASDNSGVTQIEWWSSAGAGGTATGTSNWDIDTIYLIEGENVITITATDDAGNKSTDTLTVVYTITSAGGSGYTLLMSSLPDRSAAILLDGQTISGDIYVYTNPDSGVDQVAFSIDGVVVRTESFGPFDLGGTGDDIATANPFATDQLADGDHEVSAQVTLVDGGSEFLSATITVSNNGPSDTTAPAVAITSPTTSTTYGTKSDSLNIGGTASDAIGVTQVAWSNSRGGSGTATGTTSWSVAGIALAEGENVITVTVSDEAGNASTGVLMVVYTIPVVPDTQGPVLQVNEPTTGGFSFIRQTSIKISGTASDNSGIKEIKWSIRQGGNGVASGTSTWEAASVPLAKYWNNITITAEDGAGNITAYDFTVFSWQ